MLGRRRVDLDYYAAITSKELKDLPLYEYEGHMVGFLALAIAHAKDDGEFQREYALSSDLRKAPRKRKTLKRRKPATYSRLAGLVSL